MIDEAPGEADPQYVTDSAGNRTGVLLDLDRYQELLDAADELDAIRAYDTAKASSEETSMLESSLRDVGRTKHDDGRVQEGSAQTD